MKKINIAELLCNCPKGMELDCTMFDNVTFVRVDNNRKQFPIEIVVGGRHTKYLTKEGCFHDNTLLPESKCVIFPKGKNTWKGFQRPFKDGDVLISVHGKPFILKKIHDNKICESYCGIRQNGEFVIESHNWTSNYNLRLATEKEKKKLFDVIKDNGYTWNDETKTLDKLMKFKDGDIVFYNDTIAIFKEWGDETLFRAYVIKYLYNNHTIVRDAPLFGKSIRREIRFATKEEKEKLFQAIKDNGYKWNEETKTLEKLIEPIFKVGDRIKNKNDKWLGTRTIQSYVVGIGYFTTINDWVRIEDQDEYELDTDAKPKFKVGDRIKYRSGEIVYRIVQITEDSYVLDNLCSIPISIEHMYNLVPNKFDITTLKPFESRVLVRNDKSAIWKPAIYGMYKDSLHWMVGGSAWIQCIPYEGNEHLLVTTNDCDEFYKTW